MPSPALDFVLASASPRRHQVLAELGYRFRVAPADVDETPLARELPLDLVRRLARSKADAAMAASDGSLPVLAADTIVALGDLVLGKPLGRDQALAMLAQLSGSMHLVHTGVALARTGLPTAVVVNSSRVWFRDLAAGEAERYWDSGEPADKAGAYGIQGIGGIFVRRLEGSFSGVMGLPVAETDQLLRSIGIDPWPNRGVPSG